MAADMPCKTEAQTGTTIVTGKQESVSQKIPKTIYGCRVESHESTRQKSGIFCTYETQRSHCRQRFYFDDPLQFCAQIESYASSNEDSGCKSGQGMEKSSRQFQHGNWKNQEQEGGYSRSTKRQKESPLCYTDGHMCHLKNAELGPKLQKYKGRVVLRGDIVNDSSGSDAVFFWTGLVCVPNDCRKSNGCYCKVTRLWRTSSWCSVCLHSSEIGGRSQIAQKS